MSEWMHRWINLISVPTALKSMLCPRLNYLRQKWKVGGDAYPLLAGRLAMR